MKEEHKITLDNGDQITFQFDRVNFSDGNSIVHYGHEVKEAIVEIFKKISNQAPEYEELALDEKTVKSIESFSSCLEEEDKKFEKRRNSIFHKGKLVLKKVGFKNIDTSLKSPSYREQYEEYIKKLEETKRVVESVKEGAIADAKTRKELADTLIPFLAILNYVIKFGEEDRNKYNELLIQKQSEIENMQSNPLTYDEQKLIDEKNMLEENRRALALFDDRLNALKKDLILYKQNRQTFLLQQSNEFQLLLSAESYLTDVVTALETQAAGFIFDKNQSRRAAVTNTLIQAGNKAYENGAALLQQNVETIGKLSLNQGIYSSTLEKISVSLRTSMNLYIEGRAAKQAQIESDRVALAEINRTLDEDIKKFALMNGENGVISSIIDEPKNISGGFQKKLTFKRNK